MSHILQSNNLPSLFWSMNWIQLNKSWNNIGQTLGLKINYTRAKNHNSWPTTTSNFKMAGWVAASESEPGWAGQYQSLHSCYTPCDPIRHKFGTQHHRRTSVYTYTWLGPYHCNGDTLGIYQPWASDRWPIWPERPRPKRLVPSPTESTPADPLCGWIQNEERS